MDEIRTEEGWQVGVQVYGGTTSAERSEAELKVIRRYNTLPSLEAENARLREALEQAAKFLDGMYPSNHGVKQMAEALTEALKQKGA